MAATSARTDDFTDGTQAAGWTKAASLTSATDATIPVTEAHGALTIAPPDTVNGGFNGYESSTATDDLTNSASWVETVQVLNTAGVAGDTMLEIGPDPSNWIRMIEENGLLFFQYQVAGAVTTVTSVTYDPVAHLWWRIRHGTFAGGAGDTVYWDTWNGSTVDGSGNPVWTNRASVARPITITAIKQSIIAGTYQAQTDPGFAVFDNFNLGPPSEQHARPSADVTDGLWLDAAGANTSLVASIDEPYSSLSDADYIQSATAPSSDTVEYSLGAVNAPGVTVDHYVRFRARLDTLIASSGAMSLVTELRQGANALSTPASWTDVLSTTQASTIQKMLTAAQIAAITDYSTLRLRHTATQAAVPMPTWQAVGTAVSAAAATVTPAWPAHVKDDIALLFIETAGGSATPTLSTANGFAAVTNFPASTGTGTAGTKLHVFWCRATSSAMAAPVVASLADHTYAVIHTFRGVRNTGNPWADAPVVGVKASASTTATVTGITTTVPNSLIVQAITSDADSTAAFASGQTNALISNITERSDAGTNAGGGGGIAVWTAGKITTGSTGNTTVTVTSSINAFGTIALAPAVNSSKARITWSEFVAPTVTIINTTIAGVSAAGDAAVLASVQATSVGATELPPASGATGDAQPSTQVTTRNPVELPPAAAATVAALASVQAAQRQPTELPPSVTGTADAQPSTQVTARNVTDIAPVAGVTADALSTIQAAIRNPVELPPVATLTAAGLASTQLAIRNPVELPPAATGTADAQSSTQVISRNATELPPVADVADVALPSTQVTSRNPTELPPAATLTADSQPSTQLATRNVTDTPGAAGATVAAPLPVVAAGHTITAPVADAAAVSQPSTQVAVRQDVVPVAVATVAADGQPAVLAGGVSVTVAPPASGMSAAALASTQATVRNAAIAAAIAATVADVMLPGVGSSTVTTVLATPAAAVFAGQPSIQVAVRQPVILPPTALLTADGLLGQVLAIRSATPGADIAAAVAGASLATVSSAGNALVLPVPASGLVDAPVPSTSVSRQPTILAVEAQAGAAILLVTVQALRHVLLLPPEAQAGVDADVPVLSAEVVAAILAQTAQATVDALTSIQATSQNADVLAAFAEALAAVHWPSAFLSGGHAPMSSRGAFTAPARRVQQYTATTRQGPSTAYLKR